MQYTGLKDKNCVEIYEGDILRYVDAKGANGKIYPPVGFHRGKFVCGENLPDSYDMRSQYLGTPSFLKTHEIIGNIYENPELLTPND